MELGKIKSFKVGLDPISVKHVESEEEFYTPWSADTESSAPGWCTDTEGIVLGVDVTKKTRFTYSPKILPGMKFKKIKFFSEFVGSEEVPLKFTLSFVNRQGRIAGKELSSPGHKAGRVCFEISILDLDISRLFRSTLTVDPLEIDEDKQVFISGAWLEINTEG